MKKQLFSLLIAALLVPSSAPTIHAGSALKGLKGTLQVIKIVGGLVITAGGVVLLALPCGIGCFIDKNKPGINELSSAIESEIEKGVLNQKPSLSTEEKKQVKDRATQVAQLMQLTIRKCSSCCKVTGAVAGIPTTIGGLWLTKSGIVGLYKLIKNKNEEEELIVE